MSPVLELDRIVRRYSQADGSELTVVDSVSLKIESGETVSVAGRSGSGKSTLLHIAAGIETPSEGRVRLGGQDLAGLRDPERSRLRGRFVGLVFQFFHLVPYLTVRENVLLPARIAGLRSLPGDEGVASGTLAPIADRLLAAVGLEDRAREPARRLSGGEMQRTAIAPRAAPRAGAPAGRRADRQPRRPRRPGGGGSALPHGPRTRRGVAARDP